MNRGPAPVVAIAAWLAFLVSTLVALHGDGAGHLALRGGADWATTGDPAAFVFAALRLVALATGWYLLVATVLAQGLATVGCARGAAAVAKLSPRTVRRLVHATAGVTLAVGPISPDHVTAAPAPAATLADAHVDESGEALTMRRIDDAPGADSITMRKVGADDPAPASAPRRTWTLAPGEHLWMVAREVVAAASATPPDDRQVDAYWRRLIAANRHRLVDRDNPDLVFAGQVLDLPDLSDPDV